MRSVPQVSTLCPQSAPPLSEDLLPDPQLTSAHRETFVSVSGWLLTAGFLFPNLTGELQFSVCPLLSVDCQTLHRLPTGLVCNRPQRHVPRRRPLLGHFEASTGPGSPSTCFLPARSRTDGFFSLSRSRYHGECITINL